MKSETLLLYTMYQIGQDVEEDPRLKVLKKEWFEGKDCLDIGCNSGVLTIQIGSHFFTDRIINFDLSQVINGFSNSLL